MSEVIINEAEETSNLNFKDVFVDENIDDKNPIDKFYDKCSSYVKLTKPTILQECPDVTRLLLMGYVSSVEEYLRNIFCDVINICETAKSKSADKAIKFGSIFYYSTNKIAEGLFDSASFASAKEIKSKTSEYLGINIKQGSSLEVAIENFDKVCHLRHCSVHSGGVLNGHNAKGLGMGKEYVNFKLKPNAAQLQEVLKICFSFVRAFNQYIFNEIVNMWKVDSLTGSWAEDKGKIEQLFDIFLSKTDIKTEFIIKNKYKLLIIPPKPDDIYPDDSQHHKNIKEIISKFINSEMDGDIINELDNLTLVEFVAVIIKFYYIDSDDTEKLLYNIFGKDENPKLKSYCIYCCFNIKNMDLTSKELELDNRKINFNTIYPYLLLLENIQIDYVIKNSKLIDQLLDIEVLPSLKRDYKSEINLDYLESNASINNENIKVVLLLQFSYLSEHGTDIAEEKTLSYILDETGNWRLDA